MRGSMKMLRYKPPMLHTMSIVASSLWLGFLVNVNKHWLSYSFGYGELFIVFL